MKKIFSFALGALMSINAWSFDNVPATFTWTVGNEAEATVVSDATDGVNKTQHKAGSALTEGTRNNLAANAGVMMVTYTPASNKPGTSAEAMIEYSVKMKKGVTFTLTNIDYDAIKQGTNNASYHWTYAVDGVEATPTQVEANDILRDNNTTGTPALHHSHAVTASAGQEVAVRFYVSGFDASKLLCLCKIVMTGTVNGEEEARAFKDFKIEFRDNPRSVILPESGDLPAGIEVSGTTYNGGQHGVQGGTVIVPVDGPVKFTIGACQHSKTEITVKKNGEYYATVSNKAACGETKPNYNQFVTWTYNVEQAATLTFEFGSQTYVPYFFAEATEFVPQVEVRYFDTDGKTLIGSETVDGGSALAFAYGAENVTVASGYAFRGWFNASVPTATKVKEGISLTEDLALYAKTSEIEEAAIGKIFDYDFRQNYFYPEDHEVLSLKGGKYNDGQHGWAFSNGNSLSIEVAGNALLSVGVCKYSNTSTTEVKDGAGKVIGELSVEKDKTTDGSELTIRYEGPATTLTFNFTATNYIHRLKVYNVEKIPAKGELGYFEIAPSDGAGLLLALASAQEGDKIFLPNGTYDLGEACLTPISKNNISIIGESMEGTIIKNTPDYHNEGIGTTATFLITATNTYLQDLTIQNAMDYFKALEVMSNGRGVCIQDKGTQTICKNVKLLSNQDTYYSNKVGAVKYFETSEIHGTVDFICGDGSVYFYGTELVCEQRNKNGGGADAVTASNADANDKGYVFDFCTLKYAEDIQGTLPVVSFGRSWNNAPKCVFLNTFLDNSNGELNMYKDANAQKDKIARWHLGAMNALPVLFGEYNSVNAAGQNITPESNNVKFVLGSSEKEMETVLSAGQAAQYTMEYTLGDWASTAKADAQQEECDLKNIDLEGIYLVVNDTAAPVAVLFTGAQLKEVELKEGAIVRKANARGGFGEPAEDGGETGIEQVGQELKAKSQKLIKDGQLFIIRDGKIYTAQGMEVKE